MTQPAVRTSASPLRGIRLTGFAASCVLVVGAVFAGVLPWRDLALFPTVRELRTLTGPAVAVVFVGISLLLLAWWRLGRMVHGEDPPSTRALTVTLAWWSAPLLIAAPMFSRDVFSYVAQGAMIVHGFDAYGFGPAYLGSPLSFDVPNIWLFTGAPYGPVFLSLAADITSITGDSSRAGIFGMRLLAWAGIGLMVWAVPRIARAYGVNPASAMWLAILNPLVVIHLAGDAHNDAIMLGLMCAGFALAIEKRPAAGSAMIALAALVKAPAGLALAFVLPMWAAQLRGTPRARWARAGLSWFCVTTMVVVLTTVIAGTGYGWVHALDTPAKAHTWTSITTDLGYWTGLAFETFGFATMDQGLFVWRVIGLGLAAACCLWLLRRPERFGPVASVGLGLGAVVVLGPVMHPWYLLWATVPLAAAATSPRLRRIVIGVSIAFTVSPLPGGVQPTVVAFAGAGAGAALVFGARYLIRHPDWPRRALASVGREMRQMTEGEPVPIDAEAADHAGRHGRDYGVMPELLAGVDVGDVDLDEWGPQHGARVPKRIGVMRPRPGVQDDGSALVGGEVKQADHLGLGVGLSDLDLEAEFLAEGDKACDEFGVRGQAVDVRLPGTQPAQIRPVQDIDLHRDDTSR